MKYQPYYYPPGNSRWILDDSGLYLPPATSTPFSPTSISSLQLWVDSAAARNFTDAGTTAVTTTGDLIRQRNDRSGNARHLSEATSGSRPSWLSTTPAAVYSNKSMDLAAPITLTGACTLIAWGTISAAFAWVPFGNSGTSQGAFIYNNSLVWIITAGGQVTVAFTGTTAAPALAVFNRTSGNAWKFQSTGMAEAAVGTQSGDVNILSEGTLLGYASTADGNHGGMMIFNDDIKGTTPYTNLLSYISDNYSVAL